MYCLLQQSAAPQLNHFQTVRMHATKMTSCWVLNVWREIADDLILQKLSVDQIRRQLSKWPTDTTSYNSGRNDCLLCQQSSLILKIHPFGSDSFRIKSKGPDRQMEYIGGYGYKGIYLSTWSKWKQSLSLLHMLHPN